MIIILLILLVMMLFAKCNGVHSYRIRSGNPGPKVLFLASTHGNEPAGYVALLQYIKSNPTISRGELIMIPTVNSCGLIANLRNNPLGDYDLNRNYPNKTYLNQQITKFVDWADWVIDLHEGWGFHKLDKRSVGSGVYPGKTNEAKEMATELINKLNISITEDYKKFVTFNLPNVKGSLRDYCNLRKKHYILVETSGIKNIQPLELRKNQQLFFIQEIISHLN